ncbi:MAG: glycosyltransferase family 4 protein [Acidimicrobiales bacterium]
MPRVLYVVHALPPEEFTGTPLVAHTYASGFAGRGWDVGVVYGSVEPELQAHQDEAFVRFPHPPIETNGILWAIEAATRTVQDQEGGDWFDDLVERFGPDLLHVVDNVSLPLAWPERAATRGVPVVRTVSCAEDLCGLIVPVSPRSGDAGYCGAPITAEHCAGCIEATLPALWGRPTGDGSEPDRPASPGLRAESLRAALVDARQRRLRRMLETKRSRALHQSTSVFDRIVFSTPGWRRYFEATLPLDPAKVRVVEMGLPTEQWPSPRRRRTRPAGDPTVFAWATTLDPARGVEDVVAAFTSPALVDRSDYRLRVHGGGDLTLVRELLDRNPNVEHAGRYDVSDLPGILARADVGISSSLFETFHRVTREYLLAGLPVVANTTFGIEGVIGHDVNGLVYDHRRPGSLADAVIAMLDDPARQERLAEGATSTPVRPSGDEIEELAALYDELLSSGRAHDRGVERPAPERPGEGGVTEVEDAAV